MFECSQILFWAFLFCFYRRDKVFSFHLFCEMKMNDPLVMGSSGPRGWKRLIAHCERTKMLWKRGKWGWRDFLLKIPETSTSSLVCLINLECSPSEKIWHGIFWEYEERTVRKQRAKTALPQIETSRTHGGEVRPCISPCSEEGQQSPELGMDLPTAF